MLPSSPLPNPSANKQGGGAGVGYVDYKLCTADLSQVCDLRQTLRLKMKSNTTKERNARKERSAKGSEARREVAIERPRDDAELRSLQDYHRRRASNRIEQMHRRHDAQTSCSRSNSSVGAASLPSGRRAQWRSSSCERTFVSCPTSSKKTTSAPPYYRASSLPTDRPVNRPRGASRRSSSCERTVASCPRSLKETKSAPPYRRASSLPTDGPADRPGATLRRKHRPQHRRRSLNESVEGIMKPRSRYSSGSGVVDIDAIMGEADVAKPKIIIPTKSCQRTSPPRKGYVRKHSKDSLCSMDTTLASSGQSLWSDGDGWVPAGVEFSSSVEL